jgi:hypothetical protein
MEFHNIFSTPQKIKKYFYAIQGYSLVFVNSQLSLFFQTHSLTLIFVFLPSLSNNEKHEENEKKSFSSFSPQRRRR